MSRDILLLGIMNFVNNLKQVIPLSIECQEISLKWSKTEDHSKKMYQYLYITT